MECVAAILIRSTAITHNHSLNDLVYKHMISPLHLLMTGNQYSLNEKAISRIRCWKCLGKVRVVFAVFLTFLVLN